MEIYCSFAKYVIITVGTVNDIMNGICAVSFTIFIFDVIDSFYCSISVTEGRQYCHAYAVVATHIMYKFIKKTLFCASHTIP